MFFVHGYASGAPYKITEAEFLNLSRSELHNIFKKYINQSNLPINEDFSGRIVLDIEDPVHLSNIGQIKESDLERYKVALELRVEVARSFFPNAKIGLHGLYATSIRCWETPNDSIRYDSIVNADRNHNFYNFIDFGTAVSYLREVPPLLGRDVNNCIAEKVTNSLKKLKQDGFELDMLPLLSLRLYNANSKEDLTWIKNKNNSPNSLFLSLVKQVQHFKNSGYSELYFWHPHLETRPANYNDWNIEDILENILEKIQ